MLPCFFHRALASCNLTRYDAWYDADFFEQTELTNYMIKVDKQAGFWGVTEFLRYTPAPTNGQVMENVRRRADAEQLAVPAVDDGEAAIAAGNRVDGVDGEGWRLRVRRRRRDVRVAQRMLRVGLEEGREGLSGRGPGHAVRVVGQPSMGVSLSSGGGAYGPARVNKGPKERA